MRLGDQEAAGIKFLSQKPSFLQQYLSNNRNNRSSVAKNSNNIQQHDSKGLQAAIAILELWMIRMSALLIKLTPCQPTPFRDITEQIDCAELIEIRRQKIYWQRQATLDLAQDRTGEALKAYPDHGAVEFSDTRSEAITKLVEDYMVDMKLRDADASRLALARARKDVHAINQAIYSTKYGKKIRTGERSYFPVCRT